ncbi:hypothetical protein DPEC_G00221630 [Dallia pectoralis]|uniref:Uncharacterized protein n=1 Tax=Dallia pectoralis TaxID=75939 RepID=A0ACC2G462_DALPE|nr:hypothetical protein DPEC_G00221630 [Dallia pectoralis]
MCIVDFENVVFTSREWNQLKDLCAVLSPFSEATELTEGEKSVTISMVVPTVLDLNTHLIDMEESRDTLLAEVETMVDAETLQNLAAGTAGTDSPKDSPVQMSSDLCSLSSPRNHHQSALNASISTYVKTAAIFPRGSPNFSIFRLYTEWTMPDFCGAFGCSNERNEKTKQQGITFHSFPSDKQRRQSWTIALRREGFKPKDRTVLCSCHFRPEDFDKSGQTVRLRQGVTPSIFTFPDHLSKPPSSSRLSRNSNKATEESPQPWSDTPVSGFVRPDHVYQSISDHQYALDPVKAKEKLAVSQENVEKLRRDLRNAKDRERRQKKTVGSLLEELKKNKILNM